MAILESPRAGSMEVQAKALNDRGDIVGFADAKNGSGPIHAILWKGGKRRGGGRSRGAARLRRLGGVRHQQRPGRLRTPLRQAGAHVPVPVGKRSDDRAEGPERAHSAGGCPGQEHDQRTGGDDRNAARRWPPARRALDTRGQGEPPSCAARTHLDERVEHQRRRHRLRLVAQAAKRRRREQPRDLGRLRQGHSPRDRARPRRRCRRSDQPLRPERRLPRKPRHRRHPG